MNRQRVISALKLILKLAFVVGVFYWLAQKDLISLSAFQRALTEPGRVTLGALALLVATLMTGTRWQLLLRAHGIELPFLRTLQLHFIGNFFNVALPGAVSGDFVKAYYVAGEIQGRRSQAFGTILFDRIIGLSALVLVSAGALSLAHGSFLDSPAANGIKAFVTLAGLGAVLFYGYLFLVPEKRDVIHAFLTWLEKKSPKVASLTRIYLGVRHYRDRRGVVSLTLLLSLLVHIAAGFACIQFAYALGETHLPAQAMYVVIPLGLLVTAIPVLPGGVGTGHAAFAALFQLIGSERGADAFSFYVIFQLLYGLAGGLVYLRFKSAQGAVPEGEPAPISQSGPAWSNESPRA